MRFTFINIRDILQKQNEILKVDSNNKWIFIRFPLLLGFLCSILFYSDTKSILGILTLFLSIFIPIFISLLATLISFVMNKIKTRHNKERIPLIKETFYNICYLIPISLFLLVLSLLMSLSIGDRCVLYQYNFNIPHMWYCLFYRDYSSFYLFVNFRRIILWWNYSFDYEYTHGD